MEKLKWGILGAGRHARRIASGLRDVPDAELLAVASRTPGKAGQLCEEFQIRRCYDDYESLLRDPEIDCVFITTTNQLHYENVMMALDYGKPIVCEKPLAVNAGQVREMVAKARRQGVFLMEAMWSRFFPVIGRLRHALDSGVIGKPQMLSANYGYRMAGYDLSSAASRIFDPARGGGALLDVGIYPLAFADFVFGGFPEAITGAMAPTPLGVDAHAVATVQYGQGRLASILCGIDGNTDTNAYIYGSEGYIRVPCFYKPDTLEIHADGQETSVIHLPFSGNGYQFELIRVGECIREGRKECPEMRLDESIALAETMDAMRKAWGLVYPFERE